uniref:Uncharacterized protein n=1 Tax=Panagrolaimus sp. JU765 TaxID=591449 RepID=A0AC34QS75_9BILA
MRDSVSFFEEEASNIYKKMYKYGKIASKRGLFEMKGNYCSLNKNSLTLEKNNCSKKELIEKNHIWNLNFLC